MIAGGYLAIPQKHKEPIQFVYKSGIYITCNEITTFSEQDNVAIRSHLFVVETTALIKKNLKPTNLLHMHYELSTTIMITTNMAFLSILLKLRKWNCLKTASYQLRDQRATLTSCQQNLLMKCSFDTKIKTKESGKEKKTISTSPIVTWIHRSIIRQFFL